jgi:predicted negative regulator of RcsB-dependent stress response
LRSDYPNTGYASRGVLVAAQALQAQNDTAGAREQLEWLAAQNKQTALQPVAKLRLAGLLLDQKEYDAALAQLKDPPAPFAALFADRRGDVLAAQGKTQEARAAWQSAIDGLSTSSSLASVVQLKLDALSGA